MEIEKKEKDIVIELDKKFENTVDFSFLRNEILKTTDIFFLTKTENQKKVFEKICQQFYLIKAAGGIVSNKSGSILFIFRNGVWDLPKGHVEKNETEEETALREVEEETGLKNSQLVIMPPSVFAQDQNIKYSNAIYTYHTYFMNNRLELKQTAWYLMEICDKNVIFYPQIEEGITLVKWIRKEDIPNILEKTYPSIKNMLEKVLEKN
ncbi:MAG: NUDIX domain-containing protein [Bacteroidales bacterium]|nr:NUDIX domain-containing protein [Bacteroidales bacterium]